MGYPCGASRSTMVRVGLGVVRLQGTRATAAVASVLAIIRIVSAAIWRSSIIKKPFFISRSLSPIVENWPLGFLFPVPRGVVLYLINIECLVFDCLDFFQKTFDSYTFLLCINNSLSALGQSKPVPTFFIAFKSASSNKRFAFGRSPS